MAAMRGFIHENPLSALIHELKVIVICVKSWVPDTYLGFCVPSFLFAEQQACWEVLPEWMLCLHNPQQCLCRPHTNPLEECLLDTFHTM